MWALSSFKCQQISSNQRETWTAWAAFLRFSLGKHFYAVSFPCVLRIRNLFAFYYPDSDGRVAVVGDRRVHRHMPSHAYHILPLRHTAHSTQHIWINELWWPLRDDPQKNILLIRAMRRRTSFLFSIHFVLANFHLCHFSSSSRILSSTNIRCPAPSARMHYTIEYTFAFLVRLRLFVFVFWVIIKWVFGLSYARTM